MKSLLALCATALLLSACGSMGMGDSTRSGQTASTESTTTTTTTTRDDETALDSIGGRMNRDAAGPPFD